MASVFADTSGFVELFVQTQQYHELAAVVYKHVLRSGRNLITTNYVIAELVPLLTSRSYAPRDRVITLVNRLKHSPSIEIVHIDVATDEQAWQFLTLRPDKVWSLVDCASFVVMHSRGIQEAFTTDHHFEQAGFTRLLK